MTVTQTQINALCVEGKILLAAYLIDEELDLPPSFTTMMDAADYLCSVDRDNIQFFLWPLLEPELRDGPFTVICGAYATLCANAGTAASNPRQEVGDSLPPVYESFDSWLGRSLGVLLGVAS